MALFSQRPRGYRVGMMLVLVAAKMALYGVVAPGWLVVKVNTMLSDATAYTGLFFSCSSGFENCVNIDLTLASVQYVAAVVFGLSSLVSLSLAYMYAILVNCCATVDRRRRTLELLSMLGGLKLFVACMIFLDHDDSDSGYINGMFYTWHYGPSFGVCITASILAMTGAVLVSRNNQPVTPYMSFTVGASSTQTVQHRSAHPTEQPANVFYTDAAGQPTAVNAAAGAPPPYGFGQGLGQAGPAVVGKTGP